MFGALREGSTLYVLDKTNKPTLRIGRVGTMTHPTGYNTLPYMQNINQTFDVVVKYDDGSTDKFEQMQTQNSVAVYNKAIVTETRELMLQEIDAMERESRKIIDSIPYHEGFLQSIGEMKAVLSPEYAKEIETDKRLNTLEQGLGAIQQSQQAILEMLSRQNAPNISKSNNKT